MLGFDTGLILIIRLNALLVLFIYFFAGLGLIFVLCNTFNPFFNSLQKPLPGICFVSIAMTQLIIPPNNILLLKTLSTYIAQRQLKAPLLQNVFSLSLAHSTKTA